MATIKEYPFDLSDLKNQPPGTPSAGDNSAPIEAPGVATPAPVPVPPKTEVSEPVTRKVSIMFEDQVKDRDERNGRVSSLAEGPSRRKSNLHNAHHDMDSSWDRPTHIEGRYKKYSTTSSVYSKKALSQHSEHVERSWWFACCQKCHQEDSGIPSWEPPHWQKICPYPLCPTYRQFAQTLSVFIIGILVWVLAWIILGETAAPPNGQLFMLAALTILAHFGGWLMFKLTSLPALIGMLLVGIFMKNMEYVEFHGEYKVVVSYIRKIALTIILTRAGMDLDPTALKKSFLTVIKLSLIPWTFECVVCAVMAVYLLSLKWIWAFLLGSIVAAVSPAVIVPCLFQLRQKGYGVSKGIPTLVLAVSGIDDAASVAVFGIVSGLIFSSASVTMNIIQAPLSVVVGTLFGLLCGYLVKVVPEKNDAFAVPLRVLMVLAGGLFCVLGSEEVGWGGAGPLAVITFAFMASKNWSDQGWEIEDNPVATAFEIFWMFFEPMLFSVTGAQIEIKTLDKDLVIRGVAILVTCVVLRILVTAACAVRSNLNLKEKFFVGLSWMAKATVQAALGPVALDEVAKMTGVSDEDREVLTGYANVVVTVCIMSIVVTAPLGAAIITFAGPRLLTRTTKPPVMEGWRRSHRPSIRDISIIDEEEVVERDPEELASPTPSETPGGHSTPAPPITVQPNHRA